MAFALTYVTGFLVVNIHHSQFGIAELSLLKARVIAAGMLFVLLTTLPIVTAARVFGIFGLSALRAVDVSNKPEDRGLQQFTLAVAMYMVCFYLALATNFMFEDGPLASHWICSGIFLIPTLVVPVLGKYFYHHPKKCSLLTVMTVSGLGWLIFSCWGKVFFIRSLWFYGCALATLWVRNSVSRPGHLKKVELERLIVVPLAMIAAFALWLYGNSKPRFGGGLPVPVQLYLSPDALKVFGAESTPVWLIDQTEFGFYVLRSKEQKRAVLVPRALIRAIDFTSEELPVTMPHTK